MQQSVTSVPTPCKYCGTICHRKGMRHGSQQYWCPSCKKYQIKYYNYKAYEVSNETIAAFYERRRRDQRYQQAVAYLSGNGDKPDKKDRQ